ncbi:MAG: hypothetical protein ACJARX_001320 [Psychroserpens sp.]
MLFSCDKKKSKKTPFEFKPKTEFIELEIAKKQDAIYNYWELIHDVVTV